MISIEKNSISIDLKWPIVICSLSGAVLGGIYGYKDAMKTIKTKPSLFSNYDLFSDTFNNYILCVSSSVIKSVWGFGVGLAAGLFFPVTLCSSAAYGFYYVRRRFFGKLN